MILDTKKVTVFCSIVSLVILVAYVALGLLGIIEDINYHIVWGCFVIAFLLWVSQEV